MIKLACLGIIETPSEEVVKIAGLVEQVKRWLTRKLTSHNQKEMEELLNRFKFQIDELKHTLYTKDTESYKSWVNKLKETCGDFLKLTKNTIEIEAPKLVNESLIKELPELIQPEQPALKSEQPEQLKPEQPTFQPVPELEEIKEESKEEPKLIKQVLLSNKNYGMYDRTLSTIKGELGVDISNMALRKKLQEAGGTAIQTSDGWAVESGVVNLDKLSFKYIGKLKKKDIFTLESIDSIELISKKEARFNKYIKLASRIPKIPLPTEQFDLQNYQIMIRDLQEGDWFIIIYLSNPKKYIKVLVNSGLEKAKEDLLIWADTLLVAGYDLRGINLYKKDHGFELCWQYFPTVFDPKKDENDLQGPLPYTKTKYSDLDVAKAMKKGYELAFGSKPTLMTLALGWSQAATESGVPFAIPQNNIGNIKASPSWIKSGKLYSIQSTKEFDENGKRYMHENAAWVAFPTLEEGAAYYWKYLNANDPNIIKAMESGDPTKTANKLKENKYYTADPKLYASGLKRYLDIFMDTLADKFAELHETSSEVAVNDRDEVDELTSQLLRAAKETGPLTLIVREAKLKQLPTVNLLFRCQDTLDNKKALQTVANISQDLFHSTHKLKKAGDFLHLELTCHGSLEKVEKAHQALVDSINQIKEFNVDIFPELESNAKEIEWDTRNYGIYA